MRKIFNSVMFFGIVVCFVAAYFNLKVFLKMRQNNASVFFSEKTLKETQESKTVIEKSIMEKDGNIESMKIEVKKAQEKEIEISRKLSEKIHESLVTKDELRKVKKEMNALTLDVKGMGEQKKQAKENEQLKKENKSLQDRIEKLKNGIGIDIKKIQKVSIPREQSKKEDKSLTVDNNKEGILIEINEKFNFAIVNLGDIDGIKKSQQLKVIRDNIVVAVLRVEKVYEKMSTAIILKDTLKVDVLIKNDLVKSVISYQ